MPTESPELEDILGNRRDLLISLSGIRGIIPQALDPGTTVLFTHAFANIVGKRVVIGRDTRPSSFFLQQIAAGTLLALGKDVLDLGVAPTPSIKAAVKLSGAKGGIIISASHNPLEWNGFKYIDGKGLFFNSIMQKKWLDAVLALKSNHPNEKKAKAPGHYHRVDAISTHIESILHHLPESKLIGEKKYLVVVDAVNGAGSAAFPALLEKLGCRVRRLYCDPENVRSFPRPAEPTKNAIRKLANAVKKRRAAIGFALDPDSDRLAVASPRLGAIHEEFTLPLSLLGLAPLLKQRAQEGKPNSIVINLSTANLCEKIGSPYKLKIFRSSVGEAHVIALMQKKKAIFGGEGNGGVILPQIPSCGRDALVGAALILSAMARENARSIDELLQRMPQLFMHKSKHSIHLSRFEDICDKFLLQFPESKVSYTDGLHLRFPDQSWLHLRPSNTEPVLRLIAEASGAKKLHRIISESRGLLKDG